ncbi:MAG: AtpZ/AtpI family protein [Chloroflexi bacterium]|nr:AtpZ/AtpI family protein [Chloroflexota bacterium]
MTGTPKPSELRGESGDSSRNSQERAESGWPATIALLGRVGGIGWFVGISIALGAYGGFWLDRQFDTAPILTIIGLALGVLTAFVGMIRLLRAIRRD